MVGPDSAPGSQPLGLWSSPATRTADSILAQPCPPPSFWRSPWPRGPPPQHPGSPPCPPLARPTPPTPRISAPALDACPLPASQPASCVSQPRSDVGGEGGGGPDDSQCYDAVPQHTATFTHRPGYRREAASGRPPPPAAGPAWQPGSGAPHHHPPRPPPPAPSPLKERKEPRRERREIERERGR